MTKMIDRKAFVLISGGLDSTVTLYQAMRDFGGHVEAVSMDYGQRHKKEIDYARTTAGKLRIEHTVMKLPGLGGSMLTSNQPIPDVKYDEIEGVSPTYVPFRNGLMLSLLTAKAQKWVNTREVSVGTINGEVDHTSVSPVREAGVYFGAHAEDAHNWAYPDCTPEFIGAMANAIYIGSYHAIRLHTPIMWMRKYQIVELGAKLDVPFENTWSCYAGGELHCGACPTCYARQEAFRLAGVTDPTKYAKKAEAPASV